MSDEYVITCYSYVWVLEGDTGKVLQGWPVKLPSETRATVLVTKLAPGENSALDIVSVDKTLFDCYQCLVLKGKSMLKIILN